MKRVDDFRLKLGRRELVPIMTGGMGVDISTTELALESARMIERVAAGYRLGMRTAELGGAFASQFTQIRELYTVCEASPVLADELVQMAILDGCGRLNRFIRNQIRVNSDAVERCRVIH